MTVRTVTLEADLATIGGIVNIGARTVVALPPSSLETGGYGNYAEGFDVIDVASDLLRVYLGGDLLITRAYDPTMES